MTETRIAARLENAALLAGVKAAAAATRARLVHWTGPIANDSTLSDSNIVLLETTGPALAVQELLQARDACPDAQFIVLIGGGASPEEVRRLFRAGARDVLTAPITQDQIMSALAEAIGPDDGGPQRGYVIAVAKSSGGAGATTVATNMAGYFSAPPFNKKEPRAPLRTALIDFDIQFGDAGLFLDLAPRKDLTEILRTPKRFDAHFLDGLIERHRTGLHLLGAPASMLPLDAVDSQVALSIVEVAATAYDLVVCELPAAWTDWTWALLRRADRIALVSTPTVRGVAGARRILDAAGAMKVEADRWRLAFNRVNGALDGKDMVDQARRSLDAEVIACLSEDSAMRDAGERGRLIWEAAPNTRCAKDLKQLCGQIELLRAGDRRSSAQRAR